MRHCFATLTFCSSRLPGRASHLCQWQPRRHAALRRRQSGVAGAFAARHPGAPQSAASRGSSPRAGAFTTHASRPGNGGAEKHPPPPPGTETVKGSAGPCRGRTERTRAPRRPHVSREMQCLAHNQAEGSNCLTRAWEKGLAHGRRRAPRYKLPGAGWGSRRTDPKTPLPHGSSAGNFSDGK